MCLLVCLKTLIGPSGAPNTPHMPLSAISLSVPLLARPFGLSFCAFKCPPIGFPCLNRHWFTCWCAPELSVCLLTHLKISGCFGALQRERKALSESPRPLHVLPKDRAGCKMLPLKDSFLEKAQPAAKIQGEAEVWGEGWTETNT